MGDGGTGQPEVSGTPPGPTAINCSRQSVRRGGWLSSVPVGGEERERAAEASVRPSGSPAAGRRLHQRVANLLVHRDQCCRPLFCVTETARNRQDEKPSHPCLEQEPGFSIPRSRGQSASTLSCETFWEVPSGVGCQGQALRLCRGWGSCRSPVCSLNWTLLPEVWSLC